MGANLHVWKVISIADAEGRCICKEEGDCADSAVNAAAQGRGPFPQGSSSGAQGNQKALCLLWSTWLDHDLCVSFETKLLLILLSSNHLVHSKMCASLPLASLADTINALNAKNVVCRLQFSINGSLPGYVCSVFGKPALVLRSCNLTLHCKLAGRESKEKACFIKMHSWHGRYGDIFFALLQLFEMKRELRIAENLAAENIFRMMWALLPIHKIKT